MPGLVWGSYKLPSSTLLSPGCPPCFPNCPVPQRQKTEQLEKAGGNGLCVPPLGSEFTAVPGAALLLAFFKSEGPAVSNLLILFWNHPLPPRPRPTHFTSFPRAHLNLGFAMSDVWI